MPFADTFLVGTVAKPDTFFSRLSNFNYRGFMMKEGKVYLETKIISHFNFTF